MSHQEPNKVIEDARLLLPWYLTNTLSDEEQDLVNRALEVSPELRKEFVREEKMMRLVKENTSLLELSALDTTEQRLSNTLARIDREAQQSAKNAEAAVLSQSAGGASNPKKRGWFQQLFDRKLFDIEWLSPANAVFASLLALQVGVLGYSQLFAGGNTVYGVASVEQASMPGTVETNSIMQKFLVEFQSTAQHGEVRDFLNSWDARIVSGPNNQDMFIVEMKTGPYTDPAAFAESLMSGASQKDVPVAFIGSKFQAE